MNFRQIKMFVYIFHRNKINIFLFYYKQHSYQLHIHISDAWHTFYLFNVMTNIYWANVLPEQWELIQLFRKHEIFRKKIRMHFEQAMIHLSKSLNFIFYKMSSGNLIL